MGGNIHSHNHYDSCFNCIYKYEKKEDYVKLLML